jgi:hypothetical protein
VGRKERKKQAGQWRYPEQDRGYLKVQRIIWKKGEKSSVG